MPYLITQIFILVILAGAGGAAIAYYLVRRSFEDVTEEVERLRAEQRSRDLGPVLEALEAHAVDIAPLVTAIEGLSARVAALEGAPAPAPQPEKASAERAAPPPDERGAPDPSANGAARNLLAAPDFGDPDELEKIRGVGPKLAKLLNEVGVYYFWQIAEWSPEDVEAVDERLEAFKGRIARDGWVEQAQGLSEGRPG